jgi:hypothetical protein
MCRWRAADLGPAAQSVRFVDEMIEHIRYEVEQIVQLSRFGNGWCELLRPDLGEFAQRSILEAGLLHFRCLIEFLGERPTSDQVRAQDYVKGWDWKISDKLSQVGELQGRLAHLGTARRRVATDGGFSWNVWLIDEAPVVLRGFRDFLMQLRTSSPQWYQMFIQPRDDLPVIDLLSLLDSVLADARVGADMPSGGESR